MRIVIKNKFVIVVAVFVLCALIIALAHFQYFDTRSKIINLFAEKQSILVEQAAFSIRRYLEERLAILHVLAETYRINNYNIREVDSQFNRFTDESLLNEGILIMDLKGDVLRTFTDITVADSIFNFTVRHNILKVFRDKYFRVAQFIYYEDSQDGTPDIIYITVPIRAASGNEERFLIELIDIRKMMKQIITPFMQTVEDHTFILSANGTVLYHPYHPNIVLNNIYRDEKKCISCHVNFSMEKTMLKKGKGWGIKQEQVTKKLLTFSMVTVAGISWSVVVNTPFEIISKANRAQFWIFFILSGSMMVAVLLGSVGFYRINKRRNEMEKETQILKTRTKYLESMQEAEQKYRSLVEQSPDAIGIIQENSIVFANEKLLHLFGYKIDEIQTENFSIYSLVADQSRKQVKDNVEAFLSENRKITHLSMQGITKNRKILDLEVSLVRFTHQGETAYHIVIHDVTEMKQNEREANRKRHLSFIGEMSTRIAHEIKNPLASLQTGIQLLESTLPMDGDIKEYFHRLTGEVKRIDGIVKGMLSYAREDRLTKTEANIKELIERVIELIKPTITDKSITWKISVPESMVSAYLDGQKFEQVLWNVIINAVQSIEEHGTIEVYVEKNGYDGLTIRIKDTGCGISEENMRRVYQPFFSTKSQGTGLGLSVCNKIIQAHGGRLLIESNVNQGTIIQINIPGN